MAGSVVAITGAKIRTSERSKINELWLGRLEAAIPAVIASIYDEVTKLQDMAKKEQRPFYEVLTAEIGWCMVRICRRQSTSGKENESDARKRCALL